MLQQKSQKLGIAALVLAAVATGGVVMAQIEGSEKRGVQPTSSSTDYEISGIEVDVRGDNAHDARMTGWREAQRKGWMKLASNLGVRSSLSDGALDGIVTAVVAEKEMIGQRRYVATLGVRFDRVRAAQILGVRAGRTQSPPLLVIPVNYVGDAAQVFEQRSEWQKAWASFKTNGSAIDYVRANGTGADTLLLQGGQIDRRSRNWWRVILDQYSAADVLIPTARLEYSYPGGPVTGHFAARYGPDNELLGSFTMTATNSAAIPEMMTKAVAKIDEIYTASLSSGKLRPDTSLVIAPSAPSDDKDDSKEKDERPTEAGERKDRTAVANFGEPSENATKPPEPKVETISISVQFDSPDEGAITAAEAAVRGVPGVQSANTNSTAIGGTSVMRVSFKGTAAELRDALASRGWRVADGGSTLRISR